MYEQIKQDYHWHGLYSDCHLFVSRCEVCSSRTNADGTHLAASVLMDPPHPFHTIAIDYKVLPQHIESEYKNLLVVVDELTRYTIAIPTRTQTAAETFRALFDHVFSVFSFPCVVRSDNGFRNELQQEFSVALTALL